MLALKNRRFSLPKDGIRTIWDDQSLFGTKAGIIQPESLITGKMSRTFFIPSTALWWAKLTAAVNFPTLGMPICVWGPCFWLQSKQQHQQKKDTRPRPPWQLTIFTTRTCSTTSICQLYTHKLSMMAWSKTGFLTISFLVHQKKRRHFER